jgi:haloalkane dehalogenase
MRATILMVCMAIGCGAPVDTAPNQRNVDVLDSQMTLIDSGSGSPIVFVHGNPVSSYVWRNITPTLAVKRRCLALDLIGMGDSEKPAIEYTLTDHLRYFDAFMEVAIDGKPARDVILVMHDWGGALGLSWARRHPDRVKGLVFSDIFIKTYPTFASLGSFGMQYPTFRGPMGEMLILQNNAMIETLLPANVKRALTETEMDVYRKPYPTPESRKPLLRFIAGWPVNGMPTDSVETIGANSQWLRETTTPTLVLAPTHEPGPFEMISAADLAELSKRDGLTVTPLGVAGHFVQEDLPADYARAVFEWLNTNRL